MLGITKFELAIIEFGVKNALEYFATPEEHHHLWDDNWTAEVKAKADEWYRLEVPKTPNTDSLQRRK